MVDYSNAYQQQDGSSSSAHRFWCSALSLVGLLLAALPGESRGLGVPLVGLLLAALPSGWLAELPHQSGGALLLLLVGGCCCC